VPKTVTELACSPSAIASISARICSVLHASREIEPCPVAKLQPVS
jgi:hypothetical protein